VKVWKSADACIQGKLHERKGIPCQDKTYALLNNDTVVISLADGASSCKYSHFGAEIVTTNICNLISKRFNMFLDISKDKVANAILEDIIGLLNRKAKELRTNTKELSSTLLFVAVRNNKYIAGHIGDGVIGALKDGKLEVLSPPDNGEFANTTYFITSADASKRFRLISGSNDEIDGFILMSDGTAESLYDKRKNELSRISKQVLEWLDDNLSSVIKEALRSNLEKSFKKRTTDDCSINILRRVKKTVEDLELMDLALQKEFLQSKNKIHTENQLRVLKVISLNQCIQKKEIFKQIGLSYKTVNKHVNDISRKKFVTLKNGDIRIRN